MLTLQKSVDGRTWHDVAASAVAVPAGGAVVSRSLGVEAPCPSTVMAPAAVVTGTTDCASTAPPDVDDLTFRLDGSGRYRNSEAVVHLYRFLLTGARAAREAAVTPSLDSGEAVVDGELVGPFRLHTASAATVRAPEGQLVSHGGRIGTAVLVEPGEEFHVLRAPGSSGATLRVGCPVSSLDSVAG